MEILDLIRQVNLSKKIKRTGWVKENIPDPESVADHIFSTVFLAMVLGPKLKVDEEKLVKMAILHDVAETRTGDVVWQHGTEKDFAIKKEKDHQELEAIKEWFDFEDQKYVGLFEEMQQQESQEAKIFKQLDSLDMALQALEYEEQHGKDLSEFFVNVDSYISDPYLKEIFTDVVSARPKKT